MFLEQPKALYRENFAKSFAPEMAVPAGVVWVVGICVLGLTWRICFVLAKRLSNANATLPSRCKHFAKAPQAIAYQITDMRLCNVDLRRRRSTCSTCNSRANTDSWIV